MCTARYVTRGVKEHNIARSGAARIGDVKWPPSITQATRGGLFGPRLCLFAFFRVSFWPHPRFRAIIDYRGLDSGGPTFSRPMAPRSPVTVAAVA